MPIQSFVIIIFFALITGCTTPSSILDDAHHKRVMPAAFLDDGANYWGFAW